MVEAWIGGFGKIAPRLLDLVPSQFELVPSLFELVPSQFQQIWNG